ncbi:DUF2141 domain-containing protein [Erythrobacter sp. THAF29]|uniref:DUF2141 domain-containing protein n=1 Tax=Erythrobacter sp. THAF29 TaxID=2587851 RepID=UPI001268B0FD|nr:DUF2141 domain-containing protein [Erythrobacter sp. THAF29]QFT76475.1 hypothetical protein FIU90_02855 [Erythrobacter sp. THAF29]
MKAIALGLSALALGASLAVAPTSAAQSGYAKVITNDMSRCAPGNGPAVRLRITGLRSGSGNLFVRTYYAKRGDWLKSKRYLTRIDAKPRAGAMTVCVPVPAAGRYAIAVQHDENGNREMDVSTDGAGMSNNPRIGSFLGIPRPPSVDKAAFTVNGGVTRLNIAMRYRD